ncbi:MAG: ABC transporter permease [Ruminococcus sp.]|nr:ABC transporter permease [Ruminococcus sp.]
MKKKLKPVQTAVISLNAAAVVSALILTAVGNSMAHSQRYNYAAERWQGDSDEHYSQVSCFFSEDAGFSTDSVNSVRQQINTALKNAAYDTTAMSKPFSDSYSSYVGIYDTRSEINGRAQAEINAVGGDFFLIHNYELIHGSYISQDDLMQDGAVIDSELAWNLYGSDDVAGMSIYINGIQCYISGIIKSSSGKTEKECAGENPKAFISYTTASSLSMNSSSFGEPQMNKFSRITCYECIMPEPVENFGTSTMQTAVADSYKDKVSLVSNSKRFSSSVRTKAMKNISKSVVRNDGIRLPYWENASRITEFRITFLYTARKYILFIPFLTLLYFIVKGFILYQKYKGRMKQNVTGFFEKKLADIKRKKTNNDERTQP